MKLVLDEPGDAEARSWFEDARLAVSSVVTYPEACAALCRRSRTGAVSADQLNGWIAELDERWRGTITIPVAERAAGGLALKHRLRGMDSVQLAAAVVFAARIRDVAPHEQVVFAAFDRRLLDAAEREGFATRGGPLE